LVNSSIFKDSTTRRVTPLGLLHIEDKGITTLRKVGNYLPINTAPPSQERLVSSRINTWGVKL
jgi:hypothetical protein